MENNTTAKKQIPAFVILGIIALVAALVLAVTNAITKGPIAEHEMAALREAFTAVMPAEEYEQVTVPANYDVRSLYAAKSGGEVIGYCVTAVGKGYNGDVAVTLGVGLDGLVTGASVGDTSFAETPGFGARAKEPAFQDQFAGMDAVNGGSFQALSGATVTSTAVLNAVNSALACVDEVALNKTPAADPLVAFGAPAEKAAPAELTGETLKGSAKGFASDVTVQITLDADGTISGISIDSTGETEGFGQRLMSEPEFGEQFIGKTGPFTLGENIDALSGATVTSTAVVEAVNTAMAAPTSASGEALTSTAQGFQSQVTVSLTVENGVIASIEVDSSGETEGFGTRAQDDEAFLSQFIGKSAPLTLGEDVNALSGATVTSTAVVEAINAMMPAAGAAPAEQAVTPLAANENADLGVREDGAAVVVPGEGYTGELNIVLNIENGQVTAGDFAAPAEEEEEEEAAPTGGVLKGGAEGFESKVKVEVTLNEDGTIATLAVDASDETPGIGQALSGNEEFAAQFIGKTAPFEIGDGIDVVAGATYTSKAVVKALNELLAVEEAEEDEEEVEEEAAAPTGEVFKGGAEGFESRVKVEVTLNEDGTIATLAVDASDETPGIGQALSGNEEFAAQFIGKTAPCEIGDGIDVVTGATYTSKAVVNALNELLAVEETEEEVEEDAAAPTGEVLKGGAEGFESRVKVEVTLNEDGTIATLMVDASDETPGIGQALSGNEEFAAQFIGKTAPFEIGDGIDVVTGATYTSKAVVKALNELLAVEEDEEEVEEEAAAPTGEVLKGGAEGFESKVKVEVTLNEDGTIATLAVDASDETPGIGQALSGNEEFAAQFIGKTAPFEIGDGIDAVAGATYTSKAVVKALNELLAVEEVEEAEEAAAPAGEVLKGGAEGFESRVKVEVTLNEDGTIATLVVDASDETPGIGQALSGNEEFAAQFIGKTAPFEIGDGIDVVTGATYTSKAVVSALNELLAVEEDEEEVEEEAAAPTGEVLKGGAEGFESRVKVEVTLNGDGTIATLAVDASDETPGIGQALSGNEEFAAQFIGKTAPFEIGDGIDAVAGATYTSKAVVKALNELLGE